MKELSIFIDESGDFGEYEPHSGYYIVTLVFHNQSIDITDEINLFNKKLNETAMPDCTIHTGPLIRREDEFKDLLIFDRKRIFNVIYNFVRATDITYHCVIVEKKHCVEDIDLVNQLTKKLSAFLRMHLEEMLSYDRIVVYYDFGQAELTKILVSVFNMAFSNVEFTKVVPGDYKLFQAADMLCTLELLSVKAKTKMLTKSDLSFFSSAKDLYKSYLKSIEKKRHT